VHERAASRVAVTTVLNNNINVGIKEGGTTYDAKDSENEIEKSCGYSDRK